MEPKHLTLIDRLLAEYALTGSLPPIGGGDHSDDQQDQKDQKDQNDQKDPPKDEWKPDATQQAAINRWLADERRKTEERIKGEQEAAAEAERKAREQKEAEKRGEFDTVKASLEGTIQTLTDERDRLKAEHAALSEYFAAQFASAVADLPEVVTAFRPAEDAPFTEQVAWLTKAQDAAKKAGAISGPGNPPNPRPGLTSDEREQARIRQRASGRYRSI